MNKRTAMIILFLGSFAATSTQMLFVKILESFLHHEVFCYTLIVSVSFFAMASAAKKSLSETRFKQLLTIQNLLFFLTPILTLALYSFPACLILRQLLEMPGSAFLRQEHLSLAVPLSVIFIFALSRLHGAEIPLLSQSSRIQFGTSLAISYIGAICGFLLTPFVLLPKFGIIPTIILISLVYFINCLLLNFQSLQSVFRKLWLFSFHCGFSILLVLTLSHSQQIENLQKTLTYSNGLEVWPEDSFESSVAVIEHLLSKMKVETIESPYQTIDLIEYQNSPANDFRMYLNGEFQFGASNEELYHQSFLRPLRILNASSVKQVLVLGAGDGLLIRDLLKNSEVEKIDLVELDNEVLNLSRNHPILKKLSGNSLSNSKVQVHVNDAFEFTRLTDRTYDLVLIDLPHPVSFALSKVYSQEFYRNIFRVLKPTGFLILDGPTVGAGNIIQNTLAAAGFPSQVSYGRGNTFIFASVSQLLFSDKQLSELEALTPEPIGSRINTIWNPKLPLLF